MFTSQPASPNNQCWEEEIGYSDFYPQRQARASVSQPARWFWILRNVFAAMYRTLKISAASLPDRTAVRWRLPRRIPGTLCSHSWLLPTLWNSSESQPDHQTGALPPSHVWFVCVVIAFLAIVTERIDDHIPNWKTSLLWLGFMRLSYRTATLLECINPLRIERFGYVSADCLWFCIQCGQQHRSGIFQSPFGTAGCSHWRRRIRTYWRLMCAWVWAWYWWRKWRTTRIRTAICSLWMRHTCSSRRRRGLLCAAILICADMPTTLSKRLRRTWHARRWIGFCTRPSARIFRFRRLLAFRRHLRRYNKQDRCFRLPCVYWECRLKCSYGLIKWRANNRITSSSTPADWGSWCVCVRRKSILPDGIWIMYGWRFQASAWDNCRFLRGTFLRWSRWQQNLGNKGVGKGSTGRRQSALRRAYCPTAAWHVGRARFHDSSCGRSMYAGWGYSAPVLRCW